MVWPGTDCVPRPRDRPHTHTHAHAHAHRHTHTHTLHNEQNSPCSWESSLPQVCSHSLSDVTINIHKCCDGGLTYLQTSRHLETFHIHTHTKIMRVHNVQKRLCVHVGFNCFTQSYQTTSGSTCKHFLAPGSSSALASALHYTLFKGAGQILHNPVKGNINCS